MDDCFKLLAALAPQRVLCIARELTKQFEDIVTLPSSDAPAWLAAKPERSKGEFVLTLGAQAASDPAQTPAAETPEPRPGGHRGTMAPRYSSLFLPIMNPCCIVFKHLLL